MSSSQSNADSVLHILTRGAVAASRDQYVGAVLLIPVYKSLQANSVTFNGVIFGEQTRDSLASKSQEDCRGHRQWRP